MTAVPISRYLVDFGPNGATGTKRSGGEDVRSDQDNVASLTARIEEARSRGFEDGRAAAQVDCDARLEEQKRLFEQQLAGERQAWASEQGDKLAERLVAGLRDAEVRLAETTARILKPFLAAAIHRQTITELQGCLERFVSRDAGVRLNVSGPEDLLHALRERLAGTCAAVTYQPSDSCDVRVTANQTIVETALGAWMAKIDEAVP